MRQLVQDYGWQGALHYIWEGDPYPQLREHLDQLTFVERKMDKPEALLVRLETALERSHLNTIDGSDAAAVVQEWQASLSNMDLRTRLALLSSDLDKLAAQVDGVASQGSVVLKEQKKVLSQRLVGYMERVDVLIAFYQKGRNTTSTSGETQ